MEAIGFYLLKSAIWITGFGLIYAVFLQNERFFQLNRIYLVAGILSSILLPLLTVKYVVAVTEIQTVTTAGALSGGVARAATRPDLLILLIYGIWLAGVLFIAARFFIQIVPVLKVAKRARPVSGYPVKLIRSSDFPTPFSLFSFVVVNPSVSETETREIMNHEVVHIRQKHWLDLLLSGFICAVQWFNPAVWIYSRFVRQNHEYLADAEALQRTSDPVLYRAALLNQIAGSPVIDLGNFFSFSLNKKRFNMMKNKISSPYRKLRLLLILPVAAIVFFAFSEPQYMVTSEGADSPPASAVQAEIIKSVKGVVLSEDGSPLEGAVIVIQGTTVGTTSDAAGRFALKDIQDDAVLIVSYVGFESKAIKVNSAGNTLTVSMKKSTVVTDTVRVGPVPPPPPPPPPAGVPTNALVVLDGQVTNRQVSDIDPEEISEITVLKGETAIKKYGEKARDGAIEITTRKKAGRAQAGDGSEEVFVVVEEMPQFPGGEEAMWLWVAQNVNYPAQAVKDGLTGLVAVSFVVSKTGKVGNMKVVRSVHPLLDAEAVRVVGEMPEWKPGSQKGRAVDVQYVIPVKFELKSALKVQKP